MNRNRLHRYERGLTADVVTQGAGISAKTLRSFENGEPVSAPTAKSLADFYGITVAELLGVEDIAA